MKEYRITKYNPTNRVNGILVEDEWTSFFDIGKVFGGVELSKDMYLSTERAYVDCCVDLIEKAQISSLVVEQLECYTEGLYIPQIISNTEEIRAVVTACLREQCWLKLTSEDFFIHFGYDYYMYIGSVLPTETVEKTAAQHGLYCELHPSPYGE